MKSLWEAGRPGVTAVAGHTACWPDGFSLTRVLTQRGQTVITLRWRGHQHEVLMGARAFRHARHKGAAQ